MGLDQVVVLGRTSAAGALDLLLRAGTQVFVGADEADVDPAQTVEDVRLGQELLELGLASLH